MSFHVTLQPFGLQFDCAEAETILEAAFRAGINLRYGCRHGGCGACKLRLAEGEVDYAPNAGSAISEAERDSGIALPCCAYPLEDVTLALDDYDEAELTPEFPPATFQAHVAELIPLTHDVMLVTLHLGEAARIAFAAGQYVELQVPGTGEYRAFSFANPPSQSDRVTCMVKLLPGGAFGDYLRSRAAAGDALALRGPYGQFRIAETAADIVMVAGGTGMAPIAAMLADLAEAGSTRNIRFYYGARGRRDLFWLAEIASIGARLASLRFVPVLSEPGPDDGWDGEIGLVTDTVARKERNLLRAEAYLCGPPGMIDAAIGVLRAAGMFQSRIRFDKFVSTAAPTSA